MTTARVAEFGDSIVLVMPQEMTERLGVRPGDEVQVAPTADGVSLKRQASLVEQQVTAAERIMEKRHDVLRRLAE